MSDHKLLEIKNLTVQYLTVDGCVHAVEGLNLSLNEGETLGLVGETGAGKTTTVKSIMRILPDPPAKIQNGEIYFEGEDLLKKSKKEMQKIRGKQISMIFQDPMTSLNPIITGGMKQRVIIAMALACNPKLLIADEPTTALDVTIQAQVLELMRKLKEQYQTSMIMITHDLGIVAEICDYVAVMYAGNIVEYGSLEQIFHRPSHPYTKGLFDCIPNMLDEEMKLVPIHGLTPDPTNLPKGCHFNPRCPYATEKCCQQVPEMYEVEPGHFVQCHLVKEGKQHE